MHKTLSFFEQDAQMALAHTAVLQLANEGNNTVDDLIDFNETTLKLLADTMKNPGGHIPNPDPNATPGTMIPHPPFTYGAKSQKHLLVAGEHVQFYWMIGRSLTAASIQWSPIIINFPEQWKALKDRKENDPLEMPKILKALPVMEGTEAFDDFLHRTASIRTIPLVYVMCADEMVPTGCPDLTPGKPHSEEHVSVKNNLISQASHAHPLF